MFLGLSFLEVWFIVTSSLLLAWITTGDLGDLEEREDERDEYSA